MNVTYENEKVKKILEDFPTLQKKCGKHAIQIKKRTQQLKSFINLKEFIYSGLDNPHFETGDLKGLIGWDINQNVRMLLEVKEVKDDGLFKRLDTIIEIKVKGVLDYHGGKKNWIIS